MTLRPQLSIVITAVVGALVASAMAAAAPAIAASAPTSALAAAAKPWRVYDPAAYARAVHSGNWVFTPEGLANKACVNHVPTGGRVALDGNIISRSGTVQRVVRCTSPTLAYAPAAAAASSCQGAISAWWAYNCAVDPAGLSYLNEQFSMPSNPQKTGALIFFFPAFTDSTGTSIVQPVLSWGANGTTGVTSDNIWYLTSWYGDSGTYYVSSSAHVNPPGTVVGKIQKGLCVVGNTECTWFITTSVGSTSVELTWNGGPEMNRVYGGVMEVPRASGCVETPPTGHEAFRNLTVNDSNGSYTPAFTPYTSTTPQCSVSAAGSSGLNTDITWAP
jgi:hypothetical protein